MDPIVVPFSIIHVRSHCVQCILVVSSGDPPISFSTFLIGSAPLISPASLTLCQHQLNHSFSPLCSLLFVLVTLLDDFPSRYQSYTMSGCAVGPDGKLLDAKYITFYKDADSSEPIGVATPSTTTAGPDPTAGARRSGRAIHPSNKIIDPDNTEASSLRAIRLSNNITNRENAEASSLATTHKRKASRTMAAARRINRKVAVDEEGSEGSTDVSEISDFEPDVVELPATSSDIEAGDTEPDEDTDIAYASTKAMGDADREVSLFSSL